jgi:L-ascorbate metabolism protein UlaG (beta-lactamase superfamily)
MSIDMRWLGTACFEMVLPGKQTVVIDPYLDDSLTAPVTSDEIEGCDYILITHGHYDHVLDVGKLTRRFDCKIFCSEVAAGSLMRFQQVPPDRITPVRPGQVVHEQGLTVEVLKGVHVDFAKEYRRLTGQDFEIDPADPLEGIKRAIRAMAGSDRVPDRFVEWMERYPQGEQLNFVLEPVGGKRIYMAGSYPDPEVIEAAGQANAHITLLQVLPGKTLAGLEEQTVSLAMASGCSIAIPQHHDPLLEGAEETDLGELRRIFAEKTDILFKELVPGKWYSFD